MKPFLIFFAVVVSLGCGAITPATPVFNPSPTNLPLSTDEPNLSLPKDVLLLYVYDGFSLLIPYPLIVNQDKHGISITDEKSNFLVTLGSDFSKDYSSPEETIDGFLAAIEKRGGSIQKSNSQKIIFNNYFGISYDLSGTVGNTSVFGRMAGVSPRPGFILDIVGLSHNDVNGEKWTKYGNPVFNKLISTIYIFDPEESCPVSVDPTYGLTQENPIQVGGNDFSGPSYERAYLDNLLGDNGETLNYERTGSFDFNSTILDNYLIKGSGAEVNLYIDEYSFSKLQAPVGFTCKGPFPVPPQE